MIISMHIPKTAGTTLGYYLEHSFQKQIYFDYYPQNYDDRGWQEDRESIIRHKEFFARFQVVHGHFIYRKYAGIFDDAQYVTFLRDPLLRLVSNFRHILSEQEADPKIHAYLAENGFSLAAFAALPGMGRALSYHLEGLAVEDWHFVGIQEEMGASLKMLSGYLGRPLTLPFRMQPHRGRILFGGGVRGFFNTLTHNPFKGDTPMLNVTKGGPSGLEGFSQAELDKVRELLGEDLELYRRGLAKFQEQKARLLD